MNPRGAIVLLVFMAYLVAASARAEGEGERCIAEPSGSVVLVADQTAEILAALDTEEFRLPADVGELIDEARRSADPADTWDLALMLELAEAAAGRVSDAVSSAQLLEEATQKARRAGDACALLMAAAASRRSDDEASYLALLDEYRAAVTAETIVGKGSSSFDLVIENRTSEFVTWYLDGDFMGSIAPGETAGLYDAPLAGECYLYAIGASSGCYWEYWLDTLPGFAVWELQP